MPPPDERARPRREPEAQSGAGTGEALEASVAPATPSGHDAAPMSKADRGNLERLARKRARVAKAMLGERAKALRADVEDQLSAEYSFDDELWAGVNRAAAGHVAEADAQVAAACRRVGIPDHLRPRLSVSWSGRGENMLASRRAELRKVAYARIDAAVESAKVHLESSLLEVETELIRDGLESAEAFAFVNQMPTPEELLPAVRLAQLSAADTTDDDGFGRRYVGWTPPQEAAGALLTPSTATTREQKRQDVARALAAKPQASNRELGRLVGADHKTVGKLRSVGGEIPSPSGEIPSPSGDFPTDGEDQS